MTEARKEVVEETPEELAVDDEVLENLAADFVPLKEVGPDASVHVDDIDHYQRDSLHAEEAYARAVEASTRGDHEQAVQEYLLAAKIAETAHEWYVAAVALERVGAFLQDPKPPLDLSRAFRTYHRAVAAYEQCGLYDEARRLMYKIQYLKLSRARELHLSIGRRTEMMLFWLIAGFGYRPLRLLGSAALIVISYGLLYWLTSGAVVASTRQPASLWECIYLSGTTFTTIGYGDFVPAPHARLLALSEGAVGALSMGFFVVILANRLRH